MDEYLQMSLSFADHTNFINPSYVNCNLRNVSITEWDIHSAGLSVLKFRKLLPKEDLDKLESLPKNVRTVKEGLLQRDNPNIATEIIETLKKAIKGFIVLNRIRPEQILTIKKDAIFLINIKPTFLIVKDIFEFRKKGEYTSCIILNNKKEFYYSAYKNIIETKGLSKDGVEFQEKYLLNDIKGFMKSTEKITPEIIYQMLSNYRRKYLNRELPIETYRELDTGKFRIKNFLVDSLDEGEKNNIDISQNYLNYILPIIQILV